MPPPLRPWETAPADPEGPAGLVVAVVDAGHPPEAVELPTAVEQPDAVELFDAWVPADRTRRLRTRAPRVVGRSTYGW